MPSFTGRVAEATDTSVTTPTGLPLTARAPVGDACNDQWWFRAAPGGPDTANDQELLVSTQRLAGWSRYNKAAAYAPGICYEGHEFKAVTKVWTSNADVPWGGAPTSWVWKGICCRSEFDYATISLSTRSTSTDLCTQTLTLTTPTGFPLLLSDGATATAGLTTIRTSTALEARHQPFTMWWNDDDLAQFSSPDDAAQLRVVMEEAAMSFRLTGLTGGGGRTAPKTTSSAVLADPTGPATTTTVGGEAQKTSSGLSSGALAGIVIGAVLALILAVLVGLMLGRRRRRRNNNAEQHPDQPELTASTETKGHGWGDKQGSSRGSNRTSWIGRILGKRRSQASPPYHYPAGHPNEGISAPEVVTEDHRHSQIRSELAGLPRSELYGDNSPGSPRAHERPSELP
ncbi:hypothetical protein PG994_006180 [Apiospora phragmitis]|uniref:Uncharacterized protein n=1 Tax=Apiospora phragmitis TaxID=2905665 RepID=A0ABR1VEB0_9PEZI